MSSHSGGLSVCSNECELTEREGGEADNLHMCPVPVSPPACWMGRVGEDWLEECPHLGSSPPFPNLIVQSNEPNPLPGSFAFIENYSELTLRGGRICKWANLTRIGLDRAFWSSYLESVKEEGRSSWVPGCIFYPTCLMFKRGGEEALFLSLLVEKKVGQNDKLPMSLLLNWSKKLCKNCELQFSSKVSQFYDLLF